MIHISVAPCPWLLCLQENKFFSSAVIFLLVIRFIICSTCSDQQRGYMLYVFFSLQLLFSSSETKGSPYIMCSCKQGALTDALLSWSSFKLVLTYTWSYSICHILHTGLQGAVEWDEWDLVLWLSRRSQSLTWTRQGNFERVTNQSWGLTVPKGAGKSK